MKKLVMLLLATLPLVVTAQVELTPEQEVEKAQRELEAAQQQLALARQRAEKAKQAAAEAKQAEVETKPVESTSGWIVPETETTVVVEKPRQEVNRNARPSKAEVLAPYLATNAVPLVDGRVEWTCSVSIPGATADVLYAQCKQFLEGVIGEDNVLKESRIALLNAQQHSMIASMRESMTIQSTYLSLNHPVFGYALQVSCSDGKATLTMSRLTYNYDQQGKNECLKAEEWITDEVAVNENRTRLTPLSGRLRRSTIDRKNQLFAAFQQAVKGR